MSEIPGSTAVAIRLREWFHRARAELFFRLLEPWSGARLLDLGGGTGSFALRLCRRVELAVTVADVDATHRKVIESRGLRFVQVPENGAVLPFQDGEFDFVLSNSVIEHVTLPKSRCRVSERVPAREWRERARAAQSRFAAEVRRIGRGYFVQTPHKHFPIDQHVHLPLVHYLPHNAVCRLVGWTDRFWVKSCHGIVDWELLTAADMRRLFPDAGLYVERLLGWPKSVVAYRLARRGRVRGPPLRRGM